MWKFFLGCPQAIMPFVIICVHLMLPFFTLFSFFTLCSALPNLYLILLGPMKLNLNILWNVEKYFQFIFYSCILFWSVVHSDVWIPFILNVDGDHTLIYICVKKNERFRNPCNTKLKCFDVTTNR